MYAVFVILCGKINNQNKGYKMKLIYHINSDNKR